MKKITKIVIGFWTAVLLIPLIAVASPVNVNRLDNNHIEPLQVADFIKAVFFTASSTSQASTFPFASTTVLSASSICLTGDLPCRTVWPTGGGGADHWATSTASTSSIYNTNMPGFVGIGTTTPASTLQVSGENPSITVVGNTMISVPTIGLTTANGFLNEGFKFYYDGLVTGATFFDNYFNTDDADMIFRTKVAGTPQVRFVIKGGGNVGVASSTPGSLFSVGNTNGINFSTATSTFSSTGGINLTAGCFAINNVCISSSGVSSAYPFPLAGNATSTLTQFNGGLTAFASSTIGDGTLGLTISGNSTTTTNSYIAGSLGIGIATSSTLLTVSRQSTIQPPISGSTAQFVGLNANPLRLTFDTHNNTNTSGTALMFRRSRGTSAAPTNDVLDDILGSINGRGYGTTGYAAGSTGLISFRSEGTFTDTSMATAITFDTTATTSVTATEKIRITGSGNVGVGTTSPFAKLSISANNGDTNPSLFVISSSTPTATSTLINIDRMGDVGIGTSTNSLVGIQVTSTDPFRRNLLTVASSTASGSTTPVFTIINNGNIGIGSSTPTARLDMFLDEFTNTGSYTRDAIKVASSTFGIKLTTFVVQGQGRLGIFNAGNQGTLPTVPLAPVHITNQSGQAAIMMSFDASALPFTMVPTYNGATARLNSLAFNSPIGSAASQVESFRIIGNGNMAIGTTTADSEKLAVFGNLTVANRATATAFTASSTIATTTLSGPLTLGSTGTSATVGNATLVAGTVTVTTGAATTNSFIQLSRKTSGGTIGTAITYTVTNGSFTINSDNPLDTSVFTWLVVN